MDDDKLYFLLTLTIGHTYLSKSPCQVPLTFEAMLGIEHKPLAANTTGRSRSAVILAAKQQSLLLEPGLLWRRTAGLRAQQSLRPSVLTGSSAVSDPDVHPDVLSCPHPDAVRRRKEREARHKQLNTEKRRTQMMESMGLKWFEGHQPLNMTTCKSADEYRAIVKRAQTEGKLLVTKFFTEDCYVCKSLYPKMKRIASDNPDVLWAKLNGTDATLVPIFQAMGIKKVPYFHMVFDGQLVSEMSVSLSTEKLSKFRAELAAHKRTQPRPQSPLTSQDDAAPSEQQHSSVQPGMEWA
uniref:Thioredoxin domain-containing protein n=1 Tax=Dunaliella tertiolecta TaxID=3047 RepID=A0A7S3QV21_DUNTE